LNFTCLISRVTGHVDLIRFQMSGYRVNQACGLRIVHGAVSSKPPPSGETYKPDEHYDRERQQLQRSIDADGLVPVREEQHSAER
jgi:hypothetical protein